MNIAVFLPNWIGDAVMATPAVRALRDHFRGARLIGVRASPTSPASSTAATGSTT